MWCGILGSLLQFVTRFLLVFIKHPCSWQLPWHVHCINRMLDAFFKDSFMNFKISIFIRVIEFKKLILNRTSCKCQIEVK